MTHTRHILVPVDSADESMRALDSTFDIARRLGARVTLLRVVHDQVFVGGPAGAPVPMAQDARAVAADARERLQELRPRFPDDVQVDVDTAIGNDIGAAIVEHAERHAVDFIAMATHGRSGLRRLLLGSVAESVLRHTTVPMLLYPLRDDG
ncbi:MAG: universal stress protein [Planctomycetota bacterium]